MVFAGLIRENPCNPWQKKAADSRELHGLVSINYAVILFIFAIFKANRESYKINVQLIKLFIPPD